MQSTHKIAGDDAEGFADYLTNRSHRGDYYLDVDNPDGETAAGVWHGSPQALATLGLSTDRPVTRKELLALMHGRSPLDGHEIRQTCGNGSKVAGVDLTFSPPKSVSALWAACSGEQREQIAQAHREAVASTIAQIERRVELVRTRKGGALQWEHAQGLVAAKFMHTSSRLTRGQERDGIPDPQLHTHVVVLGAQREDGRFAAVDSRELLRSARMNGAWYRAQLAENLQQIGVTTWGRTGKDERYFELMSVPRELAEHWSERAGEIERAAREFRRQYGRAPRGAEIDSLTTRTRGSKSAATAQEIDAAWKRTAAEHGLTSERAASLFKPGTTHSWERVDETRITGLAERLEEGYARDLVDRVTRDRSMIDDRELRALAYERAACLFPGEQADRMIDELQHSGQLIPLQGGMWTTRRLREQERDTIQRVERRSTRDVAPVNNRALQEAQAQTAAEIGSPLTAEQQEALKTITGRGGTSALVGQAGTGKGVVLRAASRAWQQEGYEVIGTAVSGATAQRLGAEAKTTSAMTTDALQRRVETGKLKMGFRTVVMMDEAGMADSKRLHELEQLTSAKGSKLVLVGDSAQLSPIGAGGLFAEIEKRAPKAELTQVKRAQHEWERGAWAELRQGNAAKALAAYQAHDRLHLAHTREQAADRMLADWNTQRLNTVQGRTVMLTDASNRELDEINRKAQALREQAGELGARRAKLPERPYDLAAGDEVIFTKQHYKPGEQRIENGTLATVKHVVDEHTVTLSTREPKPPDLQLDTRQFNDLRLAYAQHVYKAQGLTADQALVLTGGWQTDRERAYVALSRAREQTNVYAAREDLGHQGLDTDRIDRLAQVMSESNAQQASISREAIAEESRTLQHQRSMGRHRQNDVDAGISL
jgi:conjugative relaxase-like TrwC/TraI family protein